VRAFGKILSAKLPKNYLKGHGSLTNYLEHDRHLLNHAPKGPHPAMLARLQPKLAIVTTYSHPSDGRRQNL
jgi:hypothetical protein